MLNKALVIRYETDWFQCLMNEISCNSIEFFAKERKSKNRIEFTTLGVLNEVPTQIKFAFAITIN